MFLKTLIISSDKEVIREIPFRKGINLIIDESDQQITGNNIGKTTVLKLIDYCLGGKERNIYVEPESNKEYELVKNFLKDKGILITLILKENLDIDESKEITIERNFSSKAKDVVRRINNVSVSAEEFTDILSKEIFPNIETKKPTFRQIISHNFRYKDEGINNTLKTMGAFMSDAEYETLHLFMLGMPFNEGENKQHLISKLKQEEQFKNRLESKQTKNTYETALAIIDSDIEKLNNKKNTFNINENFELDLDELNEVKYYINKISFEITNLKMRKELIIESEEELKAGYSSIDLEQLNWIYTQASNAIGPLQKSFEDLYKYHNAMIGEKVKFITKELPSIELDLSRKESSLSRLLAQEKELAEKISRNDSFEELEKLIGQLNDKFRLKGEYENTINQIIEVENDIKVLRNRLEKIDEVLFSEEFSNNLQSQVVKFNTFFSTVSDELYGEKYALKFETKVDKGKKNYRFSIFDVINMSSGQKQGEISAFDIAYIQFADEIGIPTLHFILNDKKELLHDNQLIKIAEIAERSNLQFVASILKDKLPSELNNDKYFVLKLSQKEKLFKIESMRLLTF